jgi:hypothetical protein
MGPDTTPDWLNGREGYLCVQRVSEYLLHVIIEAEALSSGTCSTAAFQPRLPAKATSLCPSKEEMSAFEVAGIVLGVLPLAINTINSYRTTLSSYKTAQNDLNWLRIDLETEQVRLQNTCEILLHDIVPFSLVDPMIKNPFGADWAKYNDKLRERLWQSWTTFEAQVQVLQAAIIELENKLCIDRSGSVCVKNGHN